MMRVDHRDSTRGFALVITLALLALLILAVLALSALVRVNGQMAEAGNYQVQARQHALLALDQALNELQRHAGPDDRVTGMAGIAGVEATATSNTRYWCGVWRESDGAFLTWLTSGAINATSAGTDTIELVSAGSVGASSSTSQNVEKQTVIAGKLPVVVAETPGSPGVPATVGKFAYVVIDEGVKISAYSPASLVAAGAAIPTISSGVLTNQLRLKTAIESNAASLPRVISFEQLALLSTTVTPSVLQDTFHYVTLTTKSVLAEGLGAGNVNVNTTNTLTWRSILDSYNAVPGVTSISAANVTSRGRAIGNNFAAADAGKPADAPFTSLAGLSTYLETIFPPTASPNATEILTALEGMLTVRSDTFRIRAYGEALNRSGSGKPEGRAFCEASVQRTPDPAPNGMGRRFVVTYFRWLGPEDI
jgi:Tfp pilus assembly protein PilX